MSKNYQQMDSLTRPKNSSMPATIESVQALLNQKGDVSVNAPFSGGYTPLQVAAGWGLRDLVVALLEKNADVNKISLQNLTALNYAVFNKHHEVISILLDNNADVNHQGSSRSPIINLAITEGWESSIVKKLLKANADVNKLDQLGDTALQRAVENQNEELVEILLKANADVNQPLSRGDFILQLACSHFAQLPNFNIVKILLKANADVNARDQMGDTALQSAVENKDAKLVEILLEANADVNQSDLDLAEKFAIKKKKLALVEQLVVGRVNQGGEQAISELSNELREIYRNYQFKQLQNTKIPPEEFNSSTVSSEFNKIEQVNNQDDLNVAGAESMDLAE